MHFRRKGPRAVAAALTAALALPAAASAHVTLQPTTAPAGEFTRLDVRVPNERDDAGTVKVDVRLPQPSPFVSYEPRPGWKVTMKRSKLAKPVEVEGFEVTEGVSQITWTGDGRQGIVRPGQFVDFGLSLRMADGNPGDKLTFKALQTYQGGEVVRWIGPGGSDEPAPVVTLAGGEEPVPAAATTTPAPKDDDSNTLAIVALAAALLGLVVGVVGLIAPRMSASSRSRRSPAARSRGRSSM
jgi:periplasmic copper chaperone A